MNISTKIRGRLLFSIAVLMVCGLEGSRSYSLIGWEKVE